MMQWGGTAGFPAARKPVLLLPQASPPPQVPGWCTRLKPQPQPHTAPDVSNLRFPESQKMTGKLVAPRIPKTFRGKAAGNRPPAWGCSDSSSAVWVVRTAVAGLGAHLGQVS